MENELHTLESDLEFIEKHSKTIGALIGLWLLTIIVGLIFFVFFCARYACFRPGVLVCPCIICTAISTVIWISVAKNEL